jgi:hypothetical protein
VLKIFNGDKTPICTLSDPASLANLLRGIDHAEKGGLFTLHFGTARSKPTRRKTPGLILVVNGYKHSVPKKRLSALRDACNRAATEDVEFDIPGWRMVGCRVTSITSITVGPDGKAVTTTRPID